MKYVFFVKSTCHLDIGSVIGIVIEQSQIMLIIDWKFTICNQILESDFYGMINFCLGPMLLIYMRAPVSHPAPEGDPALIWVTIQNSTCQWTFD